MASNFLHGVDVVEQASGARPIRTIATGVIGLVGTAKRGPINVPTLISGSRREATQAFGDAGGTIPRALAGIFDQIGAPVVVVNALARTAVDAAAVQFAVRELQLGTGAAPYAIEDLVITNTAADTTYEEGTDYEFDADTGLVTSLAAGSIDADDSVKVSYTYLGDGAAADIQGGATEGAYTGIEALRQAKALGLPEPKILIAPGWSDTQAVAEALVSVANRLRAIAVADGPNTTDADAVTYRDNFDSRRLFLIDPQVMVGDPAVAEPASARVAGVIARSDAERGFWWSPSNQPIRGIARTSRPVDFVLGDATSRANFLNENAIATIVREEGYRLWGNRSCSGDPKFQFLAVGRIADAVNDRLLRGHRWAVDRTITKTYLDDVVEGVNAFLRDLVGTGAIVGGRCWADPDQNTPASIAAGKAVFSFDFTPVYPAERITFNSIITNDYLEDLV